MEPTLHSGDIILTEYMTLPKHYDIGDIVIARSPANPLLHCCKRIIGLPGDRLYRGNSLQYVSLCIIKLNFQIYSKIEKKECSNFSF